MKSLVGVWPLFRLALRRDRIKLPVTIAAIVGTTAANTAEVIDFYGKSEKEQIAYAATTAPSVISRMFGGPIDGPAMGSIVMNEVFVFVALAVAFMSTLAVVRHTRQNEETGREELIGSAVVGHFASLVAALLLVIGANIILGILLVVVLQMNNLPVAGSWAVGAVVGATGIVFACIAAITAQLTQSARGANGLAAASIGVAFLLRGVGDSIGQLTNNGLGVHSAWPSWLSPFGWGQQLYPYTQQRWWAFGLLGFFAVTSAVVALVLTAHRDIGLGMIPARRGPAAAARRLLSPLGLAWRLQKGVLLGWTIGVAIFGSTIGIVIKEFQDLFTSNDQLKEFLGDITTTASLTDAFFGAMMGMMGIIITGYALQVVLRLRTEEASGHLEPVAATGVSRYKWALSHISIAIGGVVLLGIVTGLTTGVTYILAAGVGWDQLGRLLTAAVVPLPATLSLAGFAVLIFGLLPRGTIAVAWASLLGCFLILQFGEILHLPQIVRDISPFTHIPLVPAQPFVALPLVVIATVALLFGAVGLLLFRRRDITTS